MARPIEFSRRSKGPFETRNNGLAKSRGIEPLAPINGGDEGKFTTNLGHSSMNWNKRKALPHFIREEVEDPAEQMRGKLAGRDGMEGCLESGREPSTIPPGDSLRSWRN